MKIFLERIKDKRKMANKYKFKSISLNNDIMEKVENLSNKLVSGKKLSNAKTIKFFVQVVDRISQPKIVQPEAYERTNHKT